MCIQRIFPFVLVLLSLSCTKDFQAGNVDFDVKIVNTSKLAAVTFKAGDTVSFIFNGNPDRISFFSGEKGRRYEYRNRVSDTSTNVQLYFSTALNTPAASGSLSLLVSTDFKGYTQNNAIDSINIPLATWTDISSRAAFATNATTVNAGPVKLADYAAAGKPVYLAFKYLANSGVTQSKWTVSNIGVRHITNDTTYVIDSSAFILPVTFPSWTISPGWGAVNVSNPALKFSPTVSAQTATAFVVGGNGTAATAEKTENWIVTGPLNLSRVLPDAGVPVKDMTSNAATTSYAGINTTTPAFANYAYRFMRPGIYNITFLASNDNTNGQNVVAKTYTITVQ
jgi:hypothetical protein